MLCTVTEDKGRILLSHSSFEEGAIIFEEPPLHIVAEEEGNPAFGVLKELCDDYSTDFDYEPLWYWTALNSLTEEDLSKGRPKSGKLKTITPDQQRRLIYLYHAKVTEASAAVKKIIATMGLGVDELKLEELLQIWILNCFEHSDSPLGYSTYFMSSFMSHSCFPNAVWHYVNDDTFALRARRVISPGDEICISYLSEDALLECAASRQKHLEDSKHFKCTCERCAPTNGELAHDPCRGFICQHCNQPGLFCKLGDFKGIRNVDMIMNVACRFCGVKVAQSEAEALLKEEKWLHDQLDDWDRKVEKKQYIAKFLQESMVLDVVRRVEKMIGPQHWLCDRFWSHLSDWNDGMKLHEQAQSMMDKRVDYQRTAYPGLSGTLAWTLESQADMILRHAGFKGDSAKKTMHDERVKASLLGAAPKIFKIYEASMRILRLMFGQEHEYFTSVADKYKDVKEAVKAA